jgi:hypothetical protein
MLIEENFVSKCYKEIIDLYDSEYVIDAVIRSDYYRGVLLDTIKTTISFMDNEDKEFFSKHDDGRMMLNLFRESEGSRIMLNLLLEAGYARDVVGVLEEDLNIALLERDEE